VNPADVACLPSRLPLDVLVRGLLRLRRSTRRRIVDDHRLVARGRDRVRWRGETLSQGDVQQVLAALTTKGKKP